jgi:predicted Ser/Thr protein kinase
MDAVKIDELKQKFNELVKAHKWQKASAIAQEIVALQPTARSYCKSAMAYIKLRQYDVAAQNLRQALQCDPGYQPAHDLIERLVPKLETVFLAPEAQMSLHGTPVTPTANGKSVAIEEDEMLSGDESWQNGGLKALVDDAPQPPPISTTPSSPTDLSLPGEIAALDSSKIFGRYQIERELGRGGMGAVYKAYDPTLKRHVAIKVMLASEANDKSKQRFVREARMMVKLDHPNIIKVFEAGEENGRSFFTMEFIEGATLSRFLQEQHPLPQLIGLLAKVARAVHYAHSQGIIHRDLKPANIMLADGYEPKVLDFGIAQDRQQTKLTTTNGLLGTLEYMPPEQANGQVAEIDARSDVYALGCILYQMLTGRVPFQGTTPVNIMYQILRDDPVPPCRIRQGLSPDLEAVCLKALEKEKSRRYQSAQDLADELERYLAGRPVLAKPVTQLDRAWRFVQRHRLIAMGSSVMALLLVLVVVWAFVNIQAEKRRAANRASREKSGGRGI